MISLKSKENGGEEGQAGNSLGRLETPPRFPGIIKMSMTDAAEFKETAHPRGQPKNAGQFAKGAGGGSKKEEGSKGSKTGEGSESFAKVAPREKQIENVLSLSNHLKMIAKHQDAQFKKLGAKSPSQFILDNAQPYVVNDKTYQGKRDPMHECYRNATQAALSNKDRTYVEGYITVHGVPIAHAWTVDSAGQVYDSTVTPSMDVSGYFGIPFKKDYVLASGLINKHYGLLGHESEKTLMPLLQGKMDDYKTVDDPEKLSPVAIADRLSYADAIVRTVPPTDKIDTPERKAMREQIANELYEHGIDKRSRNRQATIILGLPGSGKSTFANPLVGTGALEIDPDIVKAKIPEFEGGKGAFAVHEESSEITRNILSKAVTNGDDFVWPRIDSPEKLVKDLKSLKDAGYSVNVKYIDADPKVALSNAISRFIKTGRYVSTETIKSYGDSPRKAYEAARSSGLIDGSEAYKSERGKGFSKIENE